jgi:Holliday junction resolvase
MVNIRIKGKKAEQELINILKDELGIELSRNLDQTRDGGHDILGLDGWAIEVKRYGKRREFNMWWEQTITQANQSSSIPVLAMRGDKLSWRFAMRLDDLCELGGGDYYTVEMGLQEFILLVRERMADCLQ